MRCLPTSLQTHDDQVATQLGVCRRIHAKLFSAATNTCMHADLQLDWQGRWHFCYGIVQENNSTFMSRAAWPLVARTLLALVIPCEQVGNAYVVELVQRQQQSGFGIDPQFEVNSSMMVAACGSSVSSSMQLCVSSGA